MGKVKTFVINAAILTSTSLLMRSVGMLFGVYLSNKIGALGMGLYGLIMSVYTFAVTLSLSGINLASTRMVAEELACNSEQGAKRAMRRCLLYSCFFGLLAAALLGFNASWIAQNLLNDERAIASLRLLCITLPFLSMSAAISGYFNAVRRVIKSASAQIFEQFVKIGATIALLQFLMPKGLEYACIAIVLGGAISETLSFGYLFILYCLDKRRFTAVGASRGHFTRRMLIIALPIALSTYLRSALSSINQLLIPKGLKAYGATSEQALAQYGLVCGMVLPVVNFPAAFLISFSSLLVPELAQYYTKNDRAHIHTIIHRVLQCTLLFSVGVAGVLFGFADELGQGLYQSAEAAVFIRMLAPLVMVMYLDIAVDNMLKGLNEQLRSMQYNIIDSGTCLVLIYTLLPRFGIFGYIVVIYISEILNAFLSLNRLIKVSDCQLDLWMWVLKPIIAIAFAVLLSRAGMLLLGQAVPNAILQMVLAIVFTGVLYYALLRLFGCITRRNIRTFQEAMR